MYHGMNDPFRVGLLASSEEDERTGMLAYLHIFSKLLCIFRYILFLNTVCLLYTSDAADE